MQQIHVVYTGISAVVVRSLIFQITCIGILLKLCVLGCLFRSVDLCKKEISSCNQHIQRTQNSSYTKRKNKTQEIEQFSKHLPCNICILFFVILALEKILMIIITDVWFVDMLHRNYFFDTLISESSLLFSTGVSLHAELLLLSFASRVLRPLHNKQ